MCRERAFQFESQIAPAGVNAVAMILTGDVEASDERHLIIANEHFAMIAKGEPHQRGRIKPPDFAARSQQSIPEVAWQAHRAQGIHQHAHPHAALLCANQRVPKALPHRASGENVSFQTHGESGRFNGFQHRGKNLIAAAQPLVLSAGVHVFQVAGPHSKRPELRNEIRRQRAEQ